MMIKRGWLLAIIIFGLIFVSANFNDLNQDDFNNGTYNNTIYNTNGVILSGNNLSGNYTSRIFDAGSVARWENLTASYSLPTKNYLYVADDNADVWNSIDMGVTWDLVKDDYTGAEANGAKASFFNSSKAYFIIYNQQVWASRDYGATWTKINDDYNGAEGQNPDAVAIDKNNNLYIIEGGQDVWKSSDSGTTWTKAAASFSSKASAGLVVNSSNVLITVDTGADVWKSSDSGTTWTKINDDYNGVAEGNDATAMVIDGNDNLYILDLIAVWKSSDSGTTWTKVSSDFDIGDAHNGISMLGDNNTVYIIDGNEDVYKSSDSGTTWTKQITNFNVANGAARAFSSVLKTTNLTFQVKNCSQSFCADGIWQNANLSNINLTGRYFQYKAYFTSDEAGLSPKLFNVSLDYTILDNSLPLFSNYSESPSNNSAYASGRSYVFNVTITEENPGNVWIEFNGINYTNDITNNGSVYRFSINDLAAGTYSYKWWANDSMGNLNYTNLRYYSVSKATNILTLLPSPPGWTYDYNTELTFNCPSSFGSPKIYINNLEVLNPVSIVLSAGSHNIKCNITESQNYTSGLSASLLTINKASSELSLTFDKTSPQQYKNYITPSCSIVSGIGTPVLNLNDAIINSSESILLGADLWNFNCSLTESQNYTTSTNLSQFIINKAIPTTNVITTPNYPITYNTPSNFSCSNTDGLQTKLYINGIDKTSEAGQEIVRAAGEYSVNCSSEENQNYSSSSEQINYVINKAEGSVALLLNNQENNVTIDYPEQYNLTATRLYGGVTIFLDGQDVTLTNGENVTPIRINGYYNITAVSSGDENHSSIAITRWLNVTLDTTAPNLNIESPQDGAAYGYNNFIVLGFAVSDAHLQSCLYNINNGENVSLINCENSSFSVQGDGEYNLSLYANDSLGNLAVKSTVFSVKIGAPTVTLIYPIGVYFNSYKISFAFVPEDVDLESCELFGNFNGSFELNQTNTNPLNNSENVFNLTLPDGAYIWNIKCNDSQGNFAFNGNKTFYVDTIAPSITLSEPIGTKTSWNNIPLSFSILDMSPTSCLYNVQFASGNIVKQNTSIANCLPTTFNVDTIGDYIFNLYVNDYAGNSNHSSSLF